jgi:hypothetical protein
LQLKNKVLLLHHQNVIELWCNGNTTDSGPVILGSNPGSSTEKARKFPRFFHSSPRLSLEQLVSNYETNKPGLFGFQQYHPHLKIHFQNPSRTEKQVSKSDNQYAPIPVFRLVLPGALPYFCIAQEI